MEVAERNLNYCISSHRQLVEKENQRRKNMKICLNRIRIYVKKCTFAT